jgi:hypothetical protein
MLFGEGLSELKRASVMILIDQSVASVIVLSFFYYAYEIFNSLLPPFTSGNTLIQFASRASTSWKNDFLATLLANYSYWPFVNFLNFLVVPAPLRLMVSNFCAVFWSMYLSNAQALAAAAAAASKVA